MRPNYARLLLLLRTDGNHLRRHGTQRVGDQRPFGVRILSCLTEGAIALIIVAVGGEADDRNRESRMSRPIALVTGVGPGTGAAIARRFSAGGYGVAMLARTGERLAALQQDIAGARGYVCDVTDETQLDAVLSSVRTELGTP